MNVQIFSIITIILIIFYNRILHMLYKYNFDIVNKFIHSKFDFIKQLVKIAVVTAMVITFDVNSIKGTLLINNSIDKFFAIQIWILMLFYPKIWFDESKSKGENYDRTDC